MKIIVIDKINKLGNIGDIVNVKSGYARNFLVPKGKALIATKKNIDLFEINQKNMQAKLAENIIFAQDRAEKIRQLGIVTIKAKAGEKGKLFGSIGIRNIADAITSLGVNITKSEIRLPNGTLRTIGKHEIYLHLHNDISEKLIVNIITC
ncbi:50S ribosomal protein L9 [Candidatus Pantoea edessiphila]|uniref:Large ribosomal subunit protein bL9 n=1 Tax=Candidatus Pantoea edessiphila TaxID=2044610 RepID=A0A2P5SXV2_9GAMM|nr:50S ribosomal protein L9 [Candidatus Pantoea edessiphila]MBK4775735.1 50S ribosomal protein L9 [Pantoea sp. Edef]PPI87132.1 50S ribosomal protein L9 [Candidatus Pantoea edessiphila]